MLINFWMTNKQFNCSGYKYWAPPLSLVIVCFGWAKFDKHFYFCLCQKKNTFIYRPVEFLRAISSALEVFLCSIRKLGILKGGTCILSELYWCLNGRCRSGLGNERLSNFNLFLWFLSIWSSISWSTSSSIVNCSRFRDGFTVWGSREGITLVAIKLTESPYFLSLSIKR